MSLRVDTISGVQFRASHMRFTDVRSELQHTLMSMSEIGSLRRSSSTSLSIAPSSSSSTRSKLTSISWDSDHVKKVNDKRTRQELVLLFLHAIENIIVCPLFVLSKAKCISQPLYPKKILEVLTPSSLSASSTFGLSASAVFCNSCRIILSAFT